MPIKIGLLGFGRTGSVVAQEITKDPSLSLEWVCRKTPLTDFHFASHQLGFKNDFAPFVSIDQLSSAFLKNHCVDIIIDFSSHSASQIYERIANAKIKIVSAISNYNKDEMNALNKASQKTAILYSPNITLGINWLMMASKMLSKIIPHADIEVVEEHFRDKKDISGTALKIANNLNLDPKIHVNSIRVGGIVGKHEVIFGLPNQTIRITHESIHRAAFGTGAIFAAKWLKHKDRGLFSMENVLRDSFQPAISLDAK